jgi:hypothetical protein
MSWILKAHRVDQSTDSNGFTSGTFDSTGANLLVVMLSESNTTDDAITDSKGNTWHELTQQANGGRSGVLWWSAPTTVGSGHTVTVAGVSNFSAMAIQAWSGGATGTPFDQQNGANGVGTSLATGSVTPTTDGQLVITGFQWGDTTGLATISGGGFSSGSIDDNVKGIGAQAQGVAMAHVIQTTAAASNPTWAEPGGADFIASLVATFKVGSGSTSPQLQLFRGLMG